MQLSIRQRTGLLLGPALFLLAFFTPPAGLEGPAVAALASTLWIATWWITEAAPIPITSLLPLVLFPLLGAAPVGRVAAAYANPIIYLFLGGFLIALAMERWGLHRRIALLIVARGGTSPSRLLLGFMLATAVLSMWISNTAATLMMLPIGLAVIGQVASLQLRPVAGGEAATLPGRIGRAGEVAADTPELPPRSRFGTALMLGIAYAASIGGMATLIGTPPNAVLAGVAAKTLGVNLGFLEWMLFGLPLAAAFLAVAWVILMRMLPPENRLLPGSQKLMERQLAALGSISRAECGVLAVFLLVSLAWVLRPFVIAPLLPAVDDTVISVAGGVLLFLIPSGQEEGGCLLDETVTAKIPWGILLLFGSGFALAEVFESTGLTGWLAGQLSGMAGLSLVGVLAVLATVVVFLTSFTSNTATASLFMPVAAGMAPVLGVSPLVLMATAAVAASCAFMLPAATPPNAIVFGSGYLTIPQMARVGLVLNLASIVIITLFAYLWLPLVWGL